MRFHSAIGVIAAFALLSGTCAMAQDAPGGAPKARPARRLELGKPVEGQLGPGQADVFTVEANAGQFVRVVAQQKGVDLVLTAGGPDGKELLVADSPTYELGPETVSWMAEECGTFTIQASKSARSFEIGKYEITLVARRAPAEDDASRIAAERGFYEAVTKERAGEKEKLQEALKLYEQAAGLWNKLSEPYAEALCLHRMGSIVSGAGDTQKAIALFEKALSLRRAAGDSAGEATTLNNMGLAYGSLGQKQKGLELLEQALSLVGHIEYRSMQFRISTNVGDSYSGLNDTRKALAFYDRALLLSRALGDRAGEADTLLRMGNAYYALGETRKAADLHEQALPIYRLRGDRRGEADTLLNAGNAYFALDDKRKAADLYQQALPIYRLLGDRRGEASTLHNVANSFYGLHENQKALERYRQVLPLDRALGDGAGEANALAAIGTLSFLAGQHAEALKAFEEALKLHRASGNRASESETLVAIGETYANSGEPQKALDVFQQGLAMKRALGDQKGLSTVLNDLGVTYAKHGDREKSIDAFQQALEVRRAMGDKAGEATSLQQIGLVYYTSGDRQKALDYYRQALPIERAIGDRVGEGNALGGLGVVSSELGATQEALEYFQQALPIKRAVKDRAGEAAVLNGIGGVYYAAGDKNALECLEEAARISHSIGDQANEAIALYNLGNVYSQIGQDQKALDYLQQALPLMRAGGNGAGESNTLYSLGGVYVRMGERMKARANYEEALSVARRLGYKAGEANALLGTAEVDAERVGMRKVVPLLESKLNMEREAGNRFGEVTALQDLCQIRGQLGDTSAALHDCEEALPIERASGIRQAEARTLALLGDLSHVSGQQQRAIEYYRQAQSVARALGSRVGEADALVGLANVDTALGEKEKALDRLQEALVLEREAGAREKQAITLNNLCVIHGYLGHRDEALKSCEESRTLARDLQNRALESAVAASLGFVYMSLGDYRESLKSLRQAEGVFVASGDVRHEQLALMIRGFVALKARKRKTALAYFRRALPLTRTVGDPWLEVATLAGLCLSSRGSNEDLAIVFGKQAINVLQRVRRDNSVLEDTLRSSFEKEIEGMYRAVADLLVERQRFGEAEEVLNLLKDKEAADFIRGDSVADKLRSATLLDFEKKAVDRYDQIVDQVVVIGKRQVELLAKSNASSLTDSELAESHRLEHDLEAANIVLQRFFDDQQKEFAPDSGRSKRVDEIKEAEGLQDALQKLGPGVVAIYTLVTPDKYIAMLVTSGARKAYTTTIKESELNQKIFSFRQQLQNPASDPLALAQELYRVIFPGHLRQDLDALHVKTIMWSIDGTLRYIPFQALHDGKRYLVQSFEQSLITPLSIKNLTEEPAAKWDGIGFGVSEGKSPLPSVPGELHGIFRETAEGQGPVSGVVRLNAAFTHASFDNDLRHRRNDVVHIATHFRSRPGVAANSELLLGDGPISLAEIAAKTRLFDGVELLTLSACNTAFTNKDEDGREVDSFGTIAQRLGAKGVIASLWSVDDSSTAELMRTMYSLRQDRAGLTKAEALRQAQERMVTGVLRPAAGASKAGRGLDTGDGVAARDWSHPFYWAPFILIGNWK